MKLQQLRTVCEVARHKFNLSKAAEALHTSQPGLSRQILQLEDELGVQIFVRSGKRFTGLTEPGREVLSISQRILGDMRNLKQLSEEFRREAVGSLTIANTHTQARYAVHPVIWSLMTRYAL